MSPIPLFDTRGLLPPGDHLTTFEELRASHLVVGSGPDWDTAWRLELVNNAERLIRQLWQVGFEDVYLDGSFVEDKPHPNDLDGYFTSDVTRHAERVAQLNALEPLRLWTWAAADRRLDPASGKHQLPMWFALHVELFPDFGQSTGVLDQYGQPLVFPSLFRQQRGSHAQKGILKLVPGGSR